MVYFNTSFDNHQVQVESGPVKAEVVFSQVNYYLYFLSHFSNDSIQCQVKVPTTGGVGHTIASVPC